MSDRSAHTPATPVINLVFERLQSKGCPQGLNVMAEELRWMGQVSMTYDKLWQAIRAELRNDHPRLNRVAEAVYWFTDRSIPVGWSLFLDRGMLPCFYRQYPPAIPWEDIDKPENILPRPNTFARACHIQEVWKPQSTKPRANLQHQPRVPRW